MNIVFGIFDENNNYELLRFSTASQSDVTYVKSNYPIDTSSRVIKEVCLPDIEYNISNIGKFYDPVTKTYS